MSIVKNLMDLVSPSLLDTVAGKTGEDKGAVAKAIGALAPTILAGMVNKSSDENAMSGIFNSIQSFDSGVLDNLGDLVNQGNLAQNDPKDAAGSLMGSLFGGKTTGIIDAVTSMAGFSDKKSTSSILGMVGPMVMGYLGKKITSGNMNLGGFIKMLTGEKKNIMDALPAGMGSVLGLSAAGADISAPKVSVASTESTGGGGVMKWLIPLLLIVGAAWFLMKGCGDDAEKATTNLEEKTEKLVEKVKETTTEVKENTSVFLHKLSSGVEIKGNSNGIEQGLIGFIESNKAADKTTWFDFDRLTFATGSANLDMAKSKSQLVNLHEIMKAYPNAKLKIGGYTDNTGSEAGNVKLSQSRAEAVVNALVSMGTAKDRLDPEGYGSQHPIATNETEEGRAKNRRISLRVTEK